MQNERVEILLIEDEPADASSIREMLAGDLRREFSVECVRCLADGLRLLGSRHFDCVLVALELPDSQGLETVLAVRQAAVLTPIIILNNVDDEETARKVLQMGIQDYLVKEELSGALLTRSIRHAIQRKLMARELAEIRQRFSSFMGHMPAAAWIKDLEGKYVYVNAETERIFSVSSSELEERSDDDLVPPEMARQFRKNDLRALAEGGCIQTTEMLRDAGGIEHHCIVSKFVIPGPEGMPAYVAGVAFDITERKQAEEEIRRLHADLAARAEELETANKDLEAFNYTVAHDLRRPLTNINGYCQVMAEICGDRLDEACRDYIRNIFKETLVMNQQISALLDFSQLTRTEPCFDKVDLAEIALSVAAELTMGAPGRRAAFRIQEGMTARGDAALLRLVLENLLGNAMKYTACREEAVIEFGATESDGARAFYIRDNGVGFDMGDADRLFIPFQRLPGAEAYKGFGIGLATVERIIRRHGGKIWAEGKTGAGATFYFTLPSESPSEY
ncbi:MAG TPA: ATP-binding protein [Geobacteraceae bacterium]|nr:ATP-binding protein [Geobacteraceae bacterium]